MHQLETFISQKYRPDVLGGRLDTEHKAVFRITCKKNDEDILTVNAICFGPKKDNVLVNLEHVINREDSILVFYYEDIHLRWSYVHNNNESYFLFKKNDTEQYKIKPKCLYIRGCYIDPDDKFWALLGDFFNFVELWDGKVLCSPKKQMSNESKLFQLNNSLRKASQKSSSISLGASYVIKGVKQLNLLKKNTSHIVKSLSGVRSIVVDEKDYRTWCTNNIDNIPVLFQEKINGNDLRAHVINKQIFAKRSNSKENIDYRYDANFFNLSDIENLDKDLLGFCLAVSVEEDNELLGIDFIQTDIGYVALEANPSPGWSAYHPFNGIDDDPFITELLKVLKSDEI